MEKLAFCRRLILFGVPLFLVPLCVYSQDLQALRAELIQRAERDQYYRKLNYMEMDKEAQRKAMAEGIATDSANTARMKEIVKLVGWPDQERFGEEASHAAWILVQHADHDPAFQAAMLPLLEKTVQRGEASAVELAYLVDRVRVKQKRPQVYGTQYETVEAADGSVLADEQGRIQYLPPMVEDIERLDARRKSVGLGPWKEYDERMAKRQDRKPFDKPRSSNK